MHIASVKNQDMNFPGGWWGKLKRFIKMKLIKNLFI